VIPRNRHNPVIVECVLKIPPHDLRLPNLSLPNCDQPNFANGSHFVDEWGIHDDFNFSIKNDPASGETGQRH
jgi:hypothetical protein